MSAVTEALGRRIGPLPAGAWIVAVLGGVGVAIVIRRQASSDQLASDAYAAGEQSGYDSVAQDATGGWDGSFTNAGAGNLYDPDPGTNTGPIKTNAQWRHRVATVLTDEGYRATLIETALAKWFDGKSLNRQQSEIISEALARIGPPPHPPKRGGRHGGGTTKPVAGRPDVVPIMTRDTGTVRRVS